MVMNSLISIAPRYVARMKEGKKTIEIRRRMLNLDTGSIVWVYETTPVNSVTGYFRVEKVIRLDREVAWDLHSDGMGVTRKEFDAYIQGMESVVLVCFERFYALSDPVHLHDIQEAYSEFRAPQFYSRIKSREFVENLASRI